jgi:hypothetical protein
MISINHDPRVSSTDYFLVWLEVSRFSAWVRESPSIFAFPMILALHTIGLGLIAGINAALDLRVLGAAPRIPLAEFRRFLPIMWVGLWLNVVSGMVLLIAYPTKALTNPVFYLKLTLIAAALAILKIVRRSVLVDGAAVVPLQPGALKVFAIASLVCWAGAITAGRLLAYTYVRLMASD